MVKKDEFSLVKAEINQNYKDQFLVELSNINAVHIKQRLKHKIKEDVESRDGMKQQIKELRKNLNSLFKRLDMNMQEVLELKIDREERIEFAAKDLAELIDHISEEIDFFSNRINELKTYLARGIIELENLKLVKLCYENLSHINLNAEVFNSLNYYNLRVFSTFSKNLTNLINLFDSTDFPNFYETFELSEDRIGFYILYPKDKENEFNGRIRLIHSEEVKILKKFLTKDGVNFARIDKEISFIENLVTRYQKEQNRIAKDNLIKFAGINEIVQNIEEYNWVEQQFQIMPSNRLALRFFVPSRQKKEILQKLYTLFGENIIINSIDISKKRATTEADIRLKKKKKIKKKKIKKKKIKLETKYKEEGLIEEDLSESDMESEDLREISPTIMRNFFLFRPFELITKMYGNPSYSEIDPTPIIAITFPLLFGLMFGDIGHGFTLMVSGILGVLLFRKRKKNLVSFCWIVFFCGIASFFVGFLYGEFFGEHKIHLFGRLLWDFEEHPITIPILNIQLFNPLNNIISVFYFTILIGVFHISLGWFIQVLNYWRQNRKYLAISDSLMKILLLLGGYTLIFNHGFNLNVWLAYPYPILLTLIPGILLLILKPLGKVFGISYLQEESFGGLLGEGSIETFETVLSVMSNVLSYIRLLALALAHIALIFSFNEMGNLIQGEGIGFEILRIVGSIFGNLVVIVIEGLLVFINSMRLTFYEFFFKFYRGSGIEYFPFYLDNDYSIMVFHGEEEVDIISEEIEKEIDTVSAKEEIDKALSYILKKFK